MTQDTEESTYAFFGVDLAQATQYKHEVPGWHKVIHRFQDEFPEYVSYQWRHNIVGLSKELFSDTKSYYVNHRVEELYDWILQVTDETTEIHQEFISNPPVLWKAAGDEVLFKRKLKHFCELPILIKFVSKIVERHHYFWETRRTSTHEKFLIFKGSLWVASVGTLKTKPKSGIIRNFEFDVIYNRDFLNEPSGPATKHIGGSDVTTKDIIKIQDFVGVDIDEGFRVSQYSIDRHVSITAELARILLILECIFQKKPFEYVYHEGIPLKGLLSPTTNYPKVLLKADNRTDDQKISESHEDSKDLTQMDSKDLGSIIESFFQIEENQTIQNNWIFEILDKIYEIPSRS